MKPYKKHQKCIYFAEQVREFVNPKYKESSHTTGQTVGQLVIDWEKLRRQFDGFAFVWNMKKGNQKMRPIINRQWRGRLCIENMSTAAEGLCHSIGIQKSQVDNEMKRKEIFKKRRLAGSFVFPFDRKSGRSLLWRKKNKKGGPTKVHKKFNGYVHWESKIWLLWSWCLCIFIWKCKIQLRREKRGEFSESQIGNYRSRQSEFFFALEIKKRDQQSFHNQFKNLWCVSQSMTALCMICNCTTVQLYTMHNMQLCNCTNLFLNSNREGKDQWNENWKFWWNYPWKLIKSAMEKGRPKKYKDRRNQRPWNSWCATRSLTVCCLCAIIQFYYGLFATNTNTNTITDTYTNTKLNSNKNENTNTNTAIMMFRFIDCGLHATMFFASDCNFVQQPFNDKARQATIGFGILTAPLIRIGNCCVKYQEWEVIYWPDQQKHFLTEMKTRGKTKKMTMTL